MRDARVRTRFALVIQAEEEMAVKVMRFDLESGDSYIGEMAERAGNLVTLRNYSAWYEGDARPYNSNCPDDMVRFQVTGKTVVEEF